MTSDACLPDAAINRYKNRHLVSAKLTREQYLKLTAYCKEHGYSYNSGLKSILDQFFK